MDPPATAVIDSRPEANPFAGRSVLLIAAHSDDEVLFAGSQLPLCRKLWVAHVSDGASKAAARQLGFRSELEYGHARRLETKAALRRGAIEAEHRYLGLRDRHCCLDMVPLVQKLVALITDLRPELVLTHTYEGGHPDHDTVAFAVRLGSELSNPSPPIWEMACYHGQGEKYTTHRFASDDSKPMLVRLRPEQLEMKRQMLKCYRSQQHFTEHFNLEFESFRLAPIYDFTSPPMEGLLGYEANAFGAMSPIWCLLAETALRDLNGRNPPRSTSFLKLAFRIMVKTATLRRRYPRATIPFERIIVELSRRSIRRKLPSYVRNC